MQELSTEVLCRNIRKLKQSVNDELGSVHHEHERYKDNNGDIFSLDLRNKMYVAVTNRRELHFTLWLKIKIMFKIFL